MEIKERVYTLKPYSEAAEKGANYELYLSRNDHPMMCPFASRYDNGVWCGEWCPAFQLVINPQKLPWKTEVHFKCFPQKVMYEIYY